MSLVPCGCGVYMRNKIKEKSKIIKIFHLIVASTMIGIVIVNIILFKADLIYKFPPKLLIGTTDMKLIMTFGSTSGFQARFKHYS